MTTPLDLTALLSGIRAKRGYLLPHHGLMAITAPALLDAYDAAYTAMALDDRVLSHHDREFVWLAILIATDEAIATHHIAKFKAAGGTDGEVEVILTVTALALGFESYRFVEKNWLTHLPACDPRAIYLRALRSAAASVPMRLVHMAAAAVFVCKAGWDAVALQIVAAYEDAVPELDLAEAVSLTMFPGSVPHFVEAARVWQELIVEGKVPASSTFREWAEMSGQGGFDEANRAPR
ncbi:MULTISPECIES: carboxymuconolactone decarboxylase family protein [unclassified Chelatococcus]|uniref:carboxymuconolactone decarboxylase family protein n=1 Tax=unclassified Chelatococcus TaxID=2638111 RepID=UPI001BCFA5D2|nr:MULTISPECIES: carboxymuconolactone decarboxylase family protein [unclassified Chelatococcus]CAH1651741.1 Carboxymuconolactone decarboxylase family protein [Hyphomicrobiales bacterium]MBS7743127.1 carboxymuconolactone decarboxylase family protein [Chelatococcus sp. HY11]MBX3541755.1 carboxymuconolactone decarboxylase family protein [Chelatococcus sp.]MCO5074353.1 carboxymuconolactone decarboxylase family protein [Chelatococcus sp.]CAH1693454.1 Carboxymuconolactone decarboxylase family protei